MGDSAALMAVGAALVGLLWLSEVFGDPTDGLAFYALIFSAPLLIAVGLVLFASRKEVASSRGLAGSILTLIGALFPDLIGLLLVTIGLLLLLSGVHDRSLRVGLGVTLAGVIGLSVRLEQGDGLDLFLPVIFIGVAWTARLLLRTDS